VRGGIPICWPWFAKQNVLAGSAQHGFVRTLPWTIVEATENRAGEVSVTLEPPPLRPLPNDSSPWPSNCRPSLTLHIGNNLRMLLSTSNASDQDLTLTQALHTYFRVSDVGSVGLDGVDQKTYLDKLLEFAPAVQSTPWRFADSCDRIYLDTGDKHTITDPHWHRRITVVSRYSATTVVWNPGPDGVKAFSDIPATDWPQYLCVEVANCGPKDSVHLPPGATCQLEQTLSATKI
jgi:glucose-6-phosphate 1-epimerase